MRLARSLAALLAPIILVAGAACSSGSPDTVTSATGVTPADRRAPVSVPGPTDLAGRLPVPTTSPPPPTVAEPGSDEMGAASTTDSTRRFVPGPRAVSDTGYAPFATTGGITLFHPAARVEHVGLHESNHDGAQDLAPAPTAVRPIVLETRERGTGARTAADMVVEPATEIRSPVTGTVVRGGGYVLYCDHDDHYVVIEPDDHPGWEVKLLHIDSLHVGRGDRVTAGETVLASGPTLLPFESQVDEVRTAEPAWPHVHIEVVDPSIPDRPTPGGGC